jgi:hypothetical protein
MQNLLPCALTLALVLVPLALGCAADGGQAPSGSLPSLADADPLARLGDPSLDARRQALAAFGRMPIAARKALLPQLQALLGSRTWFEQCGAASVLAGMGPAASAALPTLTSLARDALQRHDWDLARISLDAIQAIDRSALGTITPVVESLATSSDESLHFNLVLLAQDLGPAAAPLSADLVAASGDPRLAEQALLGLVRLGGASAACRAALEKALAAPDPSLCRSALHAIAALGRAGAVELPALIDALAHPELIDEVVDALAQLGPEAVAAAISRLAELSRPAAHDQRLHLAALLKRLKTSDCPPDAQDLAATCFEGDQVTVALPVTDRDDIPDALSAVVSGPPEHGQAVMTGALTLVYTSTAGFTGTDTLAWTASDGQRTSAPAHLAITVAPDTRLPHLLSATRMGDTAIRLVCDKQLDPQQIRQPGLYQLDHGVAVSAAAIEPDGKTVTITTSPLALETTYQLTAAGLHDSCRHPNLMAPITIAVAPFVHGLHADYFAGTGLHGAATTAIDHVIDFAQGPHPGQLNYSVRWQGRLQPQHSETYTLFTTSDDGSRVFIDGALIVDNWHDQAPTERSGTVALVANHLFHITVEFYQGGGGQAMSLAWSSPSTPKAVIPSEALWTTP